jgi:mannitol 2-dehydrogenase
MSNHLKPSGQIPLGDRALPLIDPRITVPSYDRQAVRRAIVHIGVGGFHRAHLAAYVDELCSAGNSSWGIVGSGVLPSDRHMGVVLRRQNGLYTLITRSAAQEATVRVIGSIVDYIYAAADTESLIQRIAHSDTHLVTMTLTEGGYPVDERTRQFDFSAALAGSNSAFGIIVAALELRQRQGMGPLSVVSCDNVIGNGDIAKIATLGVAEERSPKLRNWIEQTVAFPNSMVDRITPATTDADRNWLTQEYGIVDDWPVVSEPSRQWVIEDSFAGDRPPWEEVGVTVTNDVEPYELMKLRLLNAGHSCMAYLAALVGIERVDEAMADPRIYRYLRGFLEFEASPVLPQIAGFDVPGYVASLLERFSNPAIGDQISRLCLDGSAKFPKFLLPTIRAQLSRGGPIELSALALGGWCAYLVGVTEDGRTISHSSDPDLETARSYAEASIKEPSNFIGYRSVFGEDLPLEPRFVETFTRSLNSLRSIGVRSTLDAFLRAAER